ncbi:hypothetical protein HB943_12940 [Listeria weihenstephanensis]|uniref:Uncharacterized protein n=1 Tax=Listeria weihenstephanensis TaxID=1006155 RepID=A0A841ZA80_9LIST|nr:hypothetical protein [Listeria weihenstephanensis]MBC1501512.1 hypothetical protein [Listeria weihenstephanensis]
MSYEYSMYRTNDSGLVAIFFLFFIISYVLGAIMLYRFAKKSGYEAYAGMAWIPLLGAIYVRRKMSGDSVAIMWWSLGLVIPFLNFVAFPIVAYVYLSSIWRSYKYNTNGDSSVYMLLSLIGLGWLGDFLAGNHIDKKSISREIRDKEKEKEEPFMTLGTPKKKEPVMRTISYEELQKMNAEEQK